MAQKLTIALLLGAGLVAAAAAQPQEQEWWNGKTITRIDVTAGFRMHRWDEVDPLSPPLRMGLVLTPELRDRAVQKLFQVGWFDHRSIRIEPVPDPNDPNGVVVVVHVRELPIITELRVVGARQVKESDLRGGFRLQRVRELDPYKLHMDRVYLETTYKGKGYYFAQVADRVEDVGEGQVTLTWEITEGPQVRVRDIVFEGNHAIPSSDLERVMSTKESGLFTKQYYDERRLWFDVARLRLLYAHYGFLNMPRGEHVYAEVEPSEDRSSVTIRIKIIEDVRFSIGDLVVEGNQAIPTETLVAEMRTKVGSPCDEFKAQEDIEQVNNHYARQGRVDTEISYAWEGMGAEPVMRLRIRIDEKEPVRVGLIRFAGHVKTRDAVLRREFRDFAPGLLFDGTKLERGITRLYDTGWFEPGTVRYSHEPGRVPGTRDVKIEVQERSTGILRLLGGYSSAYGFLGVIEFTQENFDIGRPPRNAGELARGEAFVGGGQFFQVRAMPAQRTREYFLMFREPYVFGLDYGAGFRIYDLMVQREAWREYNRGLGLFGDRRWGDFRVELNFNAYLVRIGSLERDAPTLARQLRGKHTVVMIGPLVGYDSRDSRIVPTQGTDASLSWEISTRGLGSDFDFWRLTADIEQHVVIHEPEDRNRLRRHVLSFLARGGVMEPYGQTNRVPIFERFFAGGRGSVRGFRFRRMGPHEARTPVGGEAILTATVEYSFPIYSDFLRLALWYDVGNIAARVGDFGTHRFRHSIGFGIRALLPFLGGAPVAIDFGFPLVRERFDRKELITFDMGRLF